MQFLLGGSRVDNAVWMHHLDANKMAGEEARQNYTRMLQAILNKSWRQHPTKHQLYGHLPPITKTIQVRQTRHAGHCWRSRDELLSDVLLWTPTYSRVKAGWPAWTFIQQLCEDTRCSPEDLPEAMNDWEKWRERVRDIRASGTTWWWFNAKVCLFCKHLCMVLRNYSYLIWYEVFLSNTNDFQTDLFDYRWNPNRYYHSERE